MKIERCNPDTLAKPLAAYSQVVRAGSLVTTAGLIALDSDGKVVGEGDVAAQVRKTLENMVAALDAVGATLDDVIKTTLYLADMGDYAEMNAVYNEFFEGSRPATSDRTGPFGAAVAPIRDGRDGGGGGLRNYLKSSCDCRELPFDKLRANVTSSGLIGADSLVCNLR